MTLNDGAGTMARDGGHAVRPPIASVDAAELDHVYYSALFPSTCLAAPGGWPRVCARAEAHGVVCEWLFEPETIAAPGFDANDAIDFWDQVNREDWHVCELAQRESDPGATSPAGIPFYEGDVHSFDGGGGQHFWRRCGEQDRRRPRRLGCRNRSSGLPRAIGTRSSSAVATTA